MVKFNSKRLRHEKRIQRRDAAMMAACIMMQQQQVLNHAFFIIALHSHQEMKRQRSKSVKRERKPWSEIRDSQTDEDFRLRFRMSKSDFAEICNRIECNVGREVFRSEEYISLLPENDFLKRITKPKGGLISGECKVAMALRYLAGGSFLDMSMIFNVAMTTFHKIVRKVIPSWLDQPWIARFEYQQILKSPVAMEKILEEFGNLASQGVFDGCIGAMDGLAIRIEKPREYRDGVKNPGDYFCRKGFYALNGQFIVDAKKRILWLSTGHVGSAHDSSAFKSTELYNLFEQLEEHLKNEGKFLVGDSGYFLRSWLMTPFEKEVDYQSAKDCFNYYLSNCCILSECAFGEIVMRWGIFWKRICGPLAEVKFIINACCRLHNFIVTRREGLAESYFEERNSTFPSNSLQLDQQSVAASNAEMNEFVSDYYANHSNAGESLFPTVTDNGESNDNDVYHVPGEQQTIKDSAKREHGVYIRQEVANKIFRHGLRRRTNGRQVATNALGHSYIVGK